MESFLGRYKGNTRKLYDIDMRIFTDWCESVGVDPLQATRAELERFARHLEHDRGNSPSTVAHRLGVLKIFYRMALADDVVRRDPTVFLNMPRVFVDPAGIPWLDRYAMGRLMKAARETSPAHEALVVMMGVLGLRVSEACAVNIEDFRDDELGYRTLRIVGKGHKPATIPIPVPVLRVLERARDGRTSGPLILTRRGKRQTRNGAYDWIKRLARKAGVQAITDRTLQVALGVGRGGALALHLAGDAVGVAEVRDGGGLPTDGRAADLSPRLEFERWPRHQATRSRCSHCPAPSRGFT